MKSLQSQDETDDFVHVVLAKLERNNTNLIVKLQEPGRLLPMELHIQHILKHQNNIIRYICDFSCTFDAIVWKKPIRTLDTHQFCIDKGVRYHMILMEYIQHDLANFLENSSYNETILRSLILQVGLSLLEIHINHGISHNDIHRGNVLLDIDTPKDIVYTIGECTKTVSTYGHEVIFIDFQRGNILGKDDTANLCQLASDEISLAFERMGKWVKSEYKSLLQELMRRTMECKNTKGLFDSICNT